MEMKGDAFAEVNPGAAGSSLRKSTAFYLPVPTHIVCL